MLKTKIMSSEHSYTVIYEPVKEGGYQAVVPLLPGVVTYGRDFEEVRRMAKDAIACYLEALLKERAAIPKELGVLQEKVTVSLGD